MKRIVAFDISDDKVRYKMVKLLLSRGIRLQESVFALQIDREDMDDLEAKIRELIENKGIVHIFQLCSSCEEKSLAINCNYQYCVIV
jgi:CRISPR-associated endonuclease Cas2